jgi:ribosomal protein S8E
MFPLTTRTSFRKTRGKNKNKRLNELVKNDPINLLFEEECWAPVGENSSCWSRKIFEVVENHSDLHYVRWGLVPKSMNQMLEALVMVRLSLCALCHLLQIM